MHYEGGLRRLVRREHGGDVFFPLYDDDDDDDDGLAL